MYFYSDNYENENSISKSSKKLREKRKDIQIRLVNIEDPINEELTEVYGVNMVPLMIFLTPRGEVAARRFVTLSAEEVVDEIADQINRGKLPNPVIEDIRTKILESLKFVTSRNDLTEAIAEQIENELAEAISESGIYELVNSNISGINHIISDLQEFKKALQKFSKKQNNFVV
jgi:hypothetical protein